MSHRERLPKKRSHEAIRVKIAGHTIHVTIGRYSDGRPAEVFIDMHKQGAPLRTFAHAFAIVISIGLQYGVPAKAFATALNGIAGGPSGDVDGADGITQASSIPDLIGKLLAQDVNHAPS